MDSSAILLALEEKNKWRERRRRLEQRLLSTQHEMMLLRQEMGFLRRQMARLEKVKELGGRRGHAALGPQRPRGGP